LIARLETLRARDGSFLQSLPPYSKAVEMIEGRAVTFETIREPYVDGNIIVVVRAFFHTWSSPTWLSFAGVGHMFADGLIVNADGVKQGAPDEVMWDFR